MGRLGRAAVWLIALATAAALAACAIPAERFERRAAALGFASILLHGDGFEHRSYVTQGNTPGSTLHVYIEHDGTPWASLDGVAADPTPRTPYALELMAKDAGPRLLLGRPCYFQVQTKPPCSPLAWTHRRYSPEVVASMVAALRGYLSEHPFRQVVLVGYSGGGTLAWLMAAQVPETIGLVTVAANLDIDAWTRLHGYSALAGSLNPAAAPSLLPAITERHYLGGRDAKVPPSVVRAFARRHTGASVVEIAEFDHTCCWLERWPGLLAPLP
jgi:pimeloyl-ACP methyl ester carboxylesterase